MAEEATKTKKSFKEWKANHKKLTKGLFIGTLVAGVAAAGTGVFFLVKKLRGGEGAAAE